MAATKQQRPPFRDYKSVLHSSLDEALASINLVSWAFPT